MERSRGPAPPYDGTTKQHARLENKEEWSPFCVPLKSSGMHSTRARALSHRLKASRKAMCLRPSGPSGGDV